MEVAPPDFGLVFPPPARTLPLSPLKDACNSHRLLFPSSSQASQQLCIIIGVTSEDDDYFYRQLSSSKKTLGDRHPALGKLSSPWPSPRKSLPAKVWLRRSPDFFLLFGRFKPVSVKINVRCHGLCLCLILFIISLQGCCLQYFTKI